MTFDDNHNHFCIYCGARLDAGQNFCTQCGKAVYREKKVEPKYVSKYIGKEDELEKEYDLKQKEAKELLVKLFDPTHMSYDKFSSSITRSNQLFTNQVKIVKKMIELDDGDNPSLHREIEAKLDILKSFINKMEDLIDELVIQLSSNKDDMNDIDSLFDEMDGLIDSVKDY